MIDLNDRQHALILAGLRRIQTMPKWAHAWLLELDDNKQATAEEINELATMLNTNDYQCITPALHRSRRGSL